MAENSDGEKVSRELYKRAQENLVASLLATRKDSADVFEILSPECFEEPKYGLIYTAAMELSRQSEIIDAYTVANYLETEGELATVDGLKGLLQLTTLGKEKGLEAPIKVYAKILRENYAKHRAKTTLSEFSERFIGDSGVTAAVALTELQSELNEQIYSISNESTLAEISAVAKDYMALLEDRKRISEENAELGDGLQGIPTSLPSLNRYTTGWKPGQMITVAAETGVGKSVFAINSAVAAMQAGKSVLFFSLEMSVEEINDRVVSSISSIPMNDLKQGDLEEINRASLDEAIADLQKAKLTIDFDAKQTVDGIRAKALKKAQSPEGLDFIVIDYLQLITPTGRFSSRQEAVADISRNMKLLAKQLGVPVMVLAQMNRSAEESEDGLPKLAGIRESGAIAQDSDVVILLHRKKSQDEDIPPTYVILAKQRNGEADKNIKCYSHLECSYFQEMVVKRELTSYSDEELAELDEGLNEDLEGIDDDLGMDDWDEFED